MASNEGEYAQLVNISGFSLHVGVFAIADEPEKLERLCRYECNDKCLYHRGCHHIQDIVVFRQTKLPVTVNNTRAPPLEAAKQKLMFDDFTNKRDFDIAGAVTDA